MSVPKNSTKIEAATHEIKATEKVVPVVVAATPVKAAEVKAMPEVKAAAVATLEAKPVAAKIDAKLETKVEGARDRSAIVALISRLRDTEADNARDAAITLGTLPVDAQAVDALIAVVRNEDSFFHPVVRAAAAQSLGKMGDRRAVDALIVATRDAMAEASEEAVKALGLLGDAKALPILLAVVANAEGYFMETVRKSAEQAVDRLKAKKA